MKGKSIKSFPIPEDFFKLVVDYDLSKAEILMYLYLHKHCLKTESGQVEFTAEELTNGPQYSIGEKEKIRLEYGTGLSFGSIKNATKGLRDKGLISVKLEGSFEDAKGDYRVFFPHPKSGDLLHVQGVTLDPTKFINQNLVTPEKKFVFLILVFPNGTLKGSSLGNTRVDGSDPSGRPVIDKEIEASFLTESLSTKESNPPSKDTLPLLAELEGTTPTQSIYTLAALQLKEAITTANKVMRKISINQWSAAFRRFHKASEVEWARVETALNWYCDHIGGEFVPEAYCAKTFCDKFNKIESARIRHKKKIEEHPEECPEEFAPPPPKIETPEESQWKRDAMAWKL